jgi:hypothetical protein
MKPKVNLTTSYKTEEQDNKHSPNFAFLALRISQKTP